MGIDENPTAAFRKAVPRASTRAGLAAAVVSGLPSTAVALWRREDPWAAARAAGTLLGKPSLPRAVAAHVALSLGWAAVLDRVLPTRRRARWGALAGLAIAFLDLAVVGRRFPRIRALPQVPQWLDHVAYGAVVGAVLAWQDEPSAHPA